MSENSRFAVAVHALTLMSLEKRPLTSEFIAGSVNTNAVVIRRVLADLRTARLVASRGGAGGGWRMLRAPEAISLRDVYRAVEAPRLFGLPGQPPNPSCPVGSTIQPLLSRQFELALQGMESALGRTTVADMLRESVSAGLNL
jgi:DNA-binding IscR family transcriptional regulator